MNDGLFRKKSMDKVSSPESLNDYVRVANPSIWMILGAIIVLLIGVCIWGIFGRLDTKVRVGSISKGGQSICYISEDNKDKLSVGDTFKIDGVEGEVLEIKSTPVQGKELSSLVRHALGISEEDWAYKFITNHKLDDGEYEAEIVIESIKPLSFVFN